MEVREEGQAQWKRVKVRRVGVEAQHFALFVPLPFQILCFLFLGLLSWNCGPRFMAITHPICAFAILVRRAMKEKDKTKFGAEEGKLLARSMEGRSGDVLVQGRAGSSEIWNGRGTKSAKC